MVAWTSGVTINATWACGGYFSSSAGDRVVLTMPTGFLKSAATTSGDADAMNCTVTRFGTSVVIPSTMYTTGLTVDDGKFAVTLTTAETLPSQCSLVCQHVTNAPRQLASDWVAQLTHIMPSETGDILIFSETTPLPTFTTPRFAPTMTTAVNISTEGLPVTARSSALLSLQIPERGPQLQTGQYFSVEFPSLWPQTNSLYTDVKMTLTINTFSVVLPSTGRTNNVYMFLVPSSVVTNASTNVAFLNNNGARLPMRIDIVGYARARTVSEKLYLSVSRYFSDDTPLATVNSLFWLPTVVYGSISTFMLAPKVPLTGSHGDLTITIVYPSIDINQGEIFNLMLPTASGSHWEFVSTRTCSLNGTDSRTASITASTNVISLLSISAAARIANLAIDESATNTLIIVCKDVMSPRVPVDSATTATARIVTGSVTLALSPSNTISFPAIYSATVLGGDLPVRFAFGSPSSATQSSLTVTITTLAFPLIAAGSAVEIVLPDRFSYGNDASCGLKVNGSDASGTLLTTTTSAFTPFGRTLRLRIPNAWPDTLEVPIVVSCAKILIATYGRDAADDGTVRLIFFGNSVASSSPVQYTEFLASVRTTASVPAFSPSITMGDVMRGITYLPETPAASAVVTITAVIWPLIDDNPGVEFTVESNAAVEILVPAAAINAGSTTGGASAATVCNMTLNIVDAETSFSNTIAVTTEAEILSNVIARSPTKQFARLRVRTAREMVLPADVTRRVATVICTNIKLPTHGLRASRVGQVRIVNTANLPMTQALDLGIPTVTPRALSVAQMFATESMITGALGAMDISFTSSLAISATDIEAQVIDYFNIEIEMPTGFTTATTRNITCRGTSSDAVWYPVTPVVSHRGVPIFRYPVKAAFAAINVNQRVSLQCRWFALPLTAQTSSSWRLSLLASPENDVVGTLQGTLGAITTPATSTNFGGVKRELVYAKTSAGSARLTVTIDPALNLDREKNHAVRVFLPSTAGLTAGSIITVDGSTNRTITCTVADELTPTQAPIATTVSVSYITSGDNDEMLLFPESRVAVLTATPLASLTSSATNPRLVLECLAMPLPPVDYAQTRDVYVGVLNAEQAVSQISTETAVLSAFIRAPIATDGGTSSFLPDSIGAVGAYRLVLSPVNTFAGTSVRVPVPPGTTRASESTAITCKLFSRLAGASTETLVSTMTWATFAYPFDYIATGPLIHNMSADTTGIIQCSNLRAPTTPAGVSALMVTTHDATGAVLNRNFNVVFAGVGARDLEGSRVLRMSPSYVSVASTLLFTFEALPFALNIDDYFVVDLPDGVLTTRATRCLVANVQAKSFAILDPLTDGGLRRIQVNVASTVQVLASRKELTVSCVFMTNPSVAMSSVSTYNMQLYSSASVLRAVSQSITFQGVLSPRLGAGSITAKYSMPYSYQSTTISVGMSPLPVDLTTSDKLVLSFPSEYETASLFNAACFLNRTLTSGTYTLTSTSFTLSSVITSGVMTYDLTVKPANTVAAIDASAGTVTLVCNEMRTPRTAIASTAATLSLYKGTNTVATYMNNEVVLPAIGYTELATDYGLFVPSNGRVAGTSTRELVLTIKPLPLMLQRYYGLELVIPVGGWVFDSDTSGNRVEPSCSYQVQTGVNGTLISMAAHTEVVATSSSLTIRAVLTLQDIANKNNTLVKLACSPIDVPATPIAAINNIVAIGLAPRNEAANSLSDDFIYFMRQSSIGMPAILSATQATQIKTYVRHSITIAGLAAPLTADKLKSAASAFSSQVVASGSLADVGVVVTHQYAVETSASTLSVATGQPLPTLRGAAAIGAAVASTKSKWGVMADPDEQTALAALVNADATATAYGARASNGDFATTALPLPGPGGVARTGPGLRATTRTYASTLYFQVSMPATFTDGITSFIDRLVLIRSSIDQAVREETRGTAVTAGALSITDTSNSCSNGVKDGTETGLDCGGSSCSQCAIGLACSASSDCLSSACDSTAGVCVLHSSQTSAAVNAASAGFAALITLVAAVAMLAF